MKRKTKEKKPPNVLLGACIHDRFIDCCYSERLFFLIFRSRVEKEQKKSKKQQTKKRKKKETKEKKKKGNKSEKKKTKEKKQSAQTSKKRLYLFFWSLFFSFSYFLILFFPSYDWYNLRRKKENQHVQLLLTPLEDLKRLPSIIEADESMKSSSRSFLSLSFFFLFLFHSNFLIFLSLSF